jgi:hypothetical protein
MPGGKGLSMAQLNAERIYAIAYDKAIEKGNTTTQASAWAEYLLFEYLQSIAPRGSYHAAIHCAKCLRRVAELEVKP